MSLLKGLKQRIKDRDSLDHELEFILAGDSSSKRVGCIIDGTESSFVMEENPVFTGTVSANRKEEAAKGSYSVAMGYFNSAIGDSSFAEGSQTIAKGDTSHAEGSLTLAVGPGSHAEGNSTGTAETAVAAHAEGQGTVVNNPGEHAEGRYNISNMGGTQDTNTISSIGIGTNNVPGNQKNAQEVMENGDTYIIGVGGYDGTNPGDSDSLQKVLGGEEHSISFGVDENGNWGYRKDGADTVIPFSNHSVGLYALTCASANYATYTFTKNYNCVIALMCQVDSDNNGDNRMKLWMNRSDNPSDWNDMEGAWTKADVEGSNASYSANQGTMWTNDNDKNKTRVYGSSNYWSHSTYAYYLNVKEGDVAKIRTSHAAITWFIGIE